MNKGAKEAFFGILIFVVTLSILLFIQIQQANATFEGKVAGTVDNVTSVLDDTNPVINITINNTLARAGANNYSVIIIKLPLEVNISSNGTTINGNASISTNALNAQNATNASYSFNITASDALGCDSLTKFRCINWSGIHLIGGDDNKKHFWFNITTYAPAKGLNISIFGYNATKDGHNYTMTYNITLNINDTVEVYINGSGIVDGANLSEKAIAGFITVKGNETDMRVTLKVFNLTGNFTGGGGAEDSLGLMMMNITWGNQTKTTSGAGANDVLFGGSIDAPVTPFSFNISRTKGGTIASGLPDGLYYLNVSVNNSHVVNYGNYSDENVSATLRIRIDNTAPTYTLAENAANTTQTAIGVDITITESGAGMNSSCVVTSHSLATVAGTGTSQTATLTGLTCGTSYTLTIQCDDRVANTGTAGSITITTDACSGSGSGGGSGGGSPGTTYVADSSLIEVMGDVSKALGEGDQIRIKTPDGKHTIKV